MSTAEPKAGVINKAGAASAGIPNFAQQTQGGDNGGGDNGDNGNAGNGGNADDNGGTGNAGANAGDSGGPTLTDDQLKQILKDKGIDFDGDFEAMKSKLSQPAGTTEPTAEEKAAQEKAMNKRMLDLHIERGGTAESFVALQQIASMDLKTLSEASIRKAMKEENFSDDEIAIILKERYYQLNPDELTRGEEESEEDFNKRKESLKKKVAFGSKKLENHALPIKKDAEETLNSLRELIKAQDDDKRVEAEFSSKVDEISKAYSRSLTFELGEIDKQKIEPVAYNVTDAQISEVVNELKDPALRQNLFFNSDGKLDVNKAFEILLKNKVLESAVKASYLEGGKREVEKFEKIFPNSPHALGVGGQQRRPTPTAGKITSAGKPTVVPNNV